MAKAEMIKKSIIENAFSEKPHDFYLVYDELTDEMIIRVVRPDTVVYTFDLEKNNRYGLLIEPKTNEIVGFTLYNFQRTHLPHWKTLKEIWYRDQVSKQFTNYMKLHYDPKEHKEHEHAYSPVDHNLQKLFIRSTDVLVEELAV